MWRIAPVRAAGLAFTYALQSPLLSQLLLSRVCRNVRYESGWDHRHALRVSDDYIVWLDKNACASGRNVYVDSAGATDEVVACEPRQYAGRSSWASAGRSIPSVTSPAAPRCWIRVAMT